MPTMLLGVVFKANGQLQDVAIASAHERVLAPTQAINLSSIANVMLFVAGDQVSTNGMKIAMS